MNWTVVTHLLPLVAVDLTEKSQYKIFTESLVAILLSLPFLLSLTCRRVHTQRTHATMCVSFFPVRSVGQIAAWIFYLQGRLSLSEALFGK